MDCPACLDPGEGAVWLELELRVRQLVERYPELGVKHPTLSESEAATTLAKLLRLYRAQGEPPALFIGDVVVVGGKLYQPGEDPLPFPGPEVDPILEKAVAKAVSERSMSPLDRLALREKLTLGAVVVGAALDSINPCDLAVLVLLLGTLIVMGKRVKIIWAGLVFAAGMFVVYFTTGFILYSILGLAVGTRAFRDPFILAILVGLWEMKDVLWYGKWFSIEVPERWKPKVTKLMASIISVPGAFVMVALGVGMIVGVRLGYL